MTGNHSTGESATFAQERAARTRDPMYEDLLLGINGLITAVQVSGADTAIKARHPELWQTAFRLIGDYNSRDAVDQQVRAKGFLAALQVIAETPGTLDRMLTSLQDELTGRLSPGQAGTTPPKVPTFIVDVQPPTEDMPSLDVKDATNWAGGVVTAVSNMGIEGLLPPVARVLWDAGGKMLASERDSPELRTGLVLMLDSLPDTLDRFQGGWAKGNGYG